MSSKINLFHDSWLNTVFEGRNKSYGAYELRQTNPKTTIYALLLGALFFGSAVSYPLIKSYLDKASEEEEKEKTDRMMGSFGTSIPSGEVVEEVANED